MSPSDSDGAAGSPPSDAAPAPVVDVHAHALPMPLLRYLADQGYADLSQLEQRVLLLHPSVSGVAQGARIPLSVDQYDIARRLASMDAAGIDLQAVSAPPFVFASMSDDVDLIMEVTRRSNDALAEYVRAGEARLCALGTIPVGVLGAAEEAQRCLDELGLAGLTMGTFGAGRELDDPINDPVWEVLSQRQAFCFVHPSRASSPSRLRDYYLLQLLGYPTETALATARLIFGGVLDRYDPVLCLAHGGGCLTGIAPRLDLGWTRKAEAQTIPAPPSEYLARLRFDTAVFDPSALRRLIEDVGADRVLLGTDMPFDLADTEAVATVRALALPGASEAAILGGNAIALVSALAARGPDPETAPGRHCASEPGEPARVER